MRERPGVLDQRCIRAGQIGPARRNERMPCSAGMPGSHPGDIAMPDNRESERPAKREIVGGETCGSRTHDSSSLRGRAEDERCNVRNASAGFPFQTLLRSLSCGA
jgi:hypothetical protein